MRSAFREDPDIIVVWELRDKETISLAIELAETGHLVIWTLHTAGSVSTISRMVSFFPPEIQWNIYSRLWECLCWVLSQRLIPLKDWEGRVWIYELMLWTLWIRNIISSGTLTQLEGTIETWRQEWMVTMENYANELLEWGKIDKESFIHYFNQKI
jgi:twitching motility protein PilT